VLDEPEQLGRERRLSSGSIRSRYTRAGTSTTSSSASPPACLVPDVDLVHLAVPATSDAIRPTAASL
jgi:hypothetical protein